MKTGEEPSEVTLGYPVGNCRCNRGAAAFKSPWIRCSHRWSRSRWASKAGCTFVALRARGNRRHHPRGSGSRPPKSHRAQPGLRPGCRGPGPGGGTVWVRCLLNGPRPVLSLSLSLSLSPSVLCIPCVVSMGGERKGQRRWAARKPDAHER